MSTRKTYSVGKIKQLVDLNGDSINFDISFRVTSRNKEHFELLVVDQTTLDNNPNLEYKKVVEGTISGNILQDKNIYQNYFLILKAENPCECDVEIIKKELPKTAQPPPTPSSVIQSGTSSGTSSASSSGATPVLKKLDDDKPGFSWMKILLIVGALVALGIGFYLYSKKESSQDSTNKKEPREAGFKFYSPPNSPGASHGASREASPRANPHGESDILARLKRLNVN
jgi:hypothetical protein